MKGAATVLLMACVACTCAEAASPSRTVIQSCLASRALDLVKVVAVPTTEVLDDTEYKPGFRAVLFEFKNKEIGYAERIGRLDNDSLDKDSIVYAGNLYRLDTARRLVAPPPNGLPRINPLLSDWLLLKERSRHYLCISSNFDGIGRSGRHQNVRFGYLLSLAPVKTLYWFAGDITLRQ